MKNLYKKTLLTTASVLLISAAADQASAQTVSVTATGVVSNALTLAVVQNLNFGTFTAIGVDANNRGEITVDTAGAVTAAGVGTGVAAVVDNTNAAEAQLTIADGADGATISVQIDVTTDPTDGTDILTFTDFFTSFNGGIDATQADGVAFNIIFDSAFGGGTNTLDIGATVDTSAETAALQDGTYNGGFDVTFSY